MAWLGPRRPADREKTEGLADETVAAYGEAVRFMLETLNPDVEGFIGRPIGSGGWQYADLPRQIEFEEQDRRDLASTFGWSS